jgi:hypothetical protein
MKQSLVIAFLLGVLIYQTFSLNKVLTLAEKLSQQARIGADAMLECRVGTASALAEPTLTGKMREILATYTFVVDKEREFLKLFPIDK